MAKNNPLFVDSTLLHGDRIGTQVELDGILLYDEESVYIVVTNQLSETQRILLKYSADNNNYQARVWLGHQKTINYRFVIEKNSKELLHSASFKTRAQYAIIEKWEPSWGEETVSDKLDTPALLPNAPLPGDYASTVASLIEKWGL